MSNGFWKPAEEATTEGRVVDTVIPGGFADRGTVSDIVGGIAQIQLIGAIGRHLENGC